MIKFRAAENRQEWDDFVDGAGGHGLQTWGWGEVKAKHGWSAERVFFERDGAVIGGAQVLRRKLPVFKAMLYVPRGPVVREEADRAEVLGGLAEWAEKYRGKAVCLMVEPDWGTQTFLRKKSLAKEPSSKISQKVRSEISEESQVDFRQVFSGKWRKSKNRILLADTVVVDLSGDMEGILERMPKNRRQDVKKYLKSGLKLSKAESEADLAGAMGVYKEIAVRAKFNLHADKYYEDIWREMGEHGWLGVVKDEAGEVLAFQWALLSGRNGFALFAGVGEEGRRRRINVGVKYECMGILKGLGVVRYDLNGLLNEGVSDYKRAFGGEEVRLCGAYELPLSAGYGVYAGILPLGKRLVHFFEKKDSGGGS